MKKTLLTLLLALVAFSALAQVRGVVYDGATGDPFMGVSVLVKGTMTGVNTGADGTFSLPAKVGDVLQFSFIGYLDQEVTITSNEPLSITLQEDINQLEEVVVVGYGTQKKSDVTGAVASFDAKQLEERPNVNIIQSLQGAVAGLNISATGSNAEGSGMTTRIRGNNSIGASNQPLVILDGVPYDGNWAEINSNDVESIEILKDASSAAIYGARGANGVILIQTKKGKKGQKLSISYNGYAAWDDAINIPRMMDGKTFYERKTEAGWPVGATEEAMHEAGESTDWLALALRRGFKHQHNLSFRGAGQTNRFYVSANLSDNRGIALGDQFNRYSFNLNFEQDLGKWVKFGTNTRFGYFDRSGSNVNFSDAYLMNPLGKPYNDDGSIRLLTWEDNNYADNPLAALNEKDSDITRNLNSNNYLDVTFPIPGLTYRLNTGYTYRTRLQQNYKGLDTVEGNKNGGVLSIDNMYRESWLVENILSYTREFGKHTIFLTGLYSAQSDDVIRNGIDASGFPNDVMTYWQPSKASVSSSSASRVTTTHISQMFRANYSYDSRYLFTATARRDGYSAFGASRKYGIFPSVAVGWNISNERFWKESKIGESFDSLKLRLSWGKNGNEAIDAYSTLPVLRGVNYLSDSGAAIFGFYPSQLASPMLGWETTSSYNAGIDFGFLKNRIHGSLDAYVSKTTDLLLPRTIPTINGTNTLLDNVGATRGSGIEFQISSVNISKRDFSWSTDFNIVHYGTRIVDVGLYDENGNPVDDVASEWFIGQPIQVNYDYVIEGVQGVGQTLSYTTPDSQPGFVIYKNVDGNDVINADDKEIIGCRTPLLTFGLNNSFSYKNFYLVVFLNGQFGETQRNYLMSGHRLSYRQNQLDKNFWTEANPTDYPMNKGDGSENTLSAGFYEKTDYIRVKDITFGYRLPQNWVRPVGLKNAEIYANVKNLYTWTTWSGLDPEFTGGGTSQRAIPQVREILVGLKLGF